MQPEQIGPFRIERQLGRGGMGTVYAGVSRDTNETAAIKVLSTALAADQDFRERFQVEVETLRQLDHENIVRLFGWGEDGDILFYTMELVEGTSLEDELRAGKQFEWSEVKEIAVQVCAALKHAHDRGVIHRDIKPANLLMTPDGTVKLLDFGIAKLFGSTNMTHTGGVVGTAEYMAPEQADGRPVGHRCDLYSLGAVLYTLLAGRPPFVARSIPELLQMQRFAQPEPIRRYKRAVPPEVEAIVLHLLEKDPERRIPNATVLKRRLEATFRGLETMRIREHLQGEDRDEDAGFDLASRPAGPNLAEPPEALGKTRVATRRPDPAAAEDADFELPTQATDALRPPEDGPSDSQARASGVRYTTVDDEPVRDGDGDDNVAPWLSPQTVLLSALLLAVGLTVWWFIQPPTADALYQRVDRRINQQGEPGKVASEDDIKLFLRYYSNDRRSREMAGYLDEIAVSQMQSRLQRLSKRPLSELDKVTLVELSYLEAIRLESTDPAACVDKLEALCALYEGGRAATSKKGRLCVKAAKQKAESLKTVARQYIKKHLTAQQKRLDRADQLAETDPQAAEKIRRAVIELYGDKHWAEAIVQRARDALQEGN